MKKPSFCRLKKVPRFEETHNVQNNIVVVAVASWVLQSKQALCVGSENTCHASHTPMRASSRAWRTNAAPWQMDLEGVGESSSPSCASTSYNNYDRWISVYNRLDETGHDQPISNPEFREQLEIHMNHLPHTWIRGRTQCSQDPFSGHRGFAWKREQSCQPHKLLVDRY